MEAKERKPPDGDEGAPAYGDETQEVEAPPRVQYNLQSRTNPTNSVFRAAVDEPFNTKSHFPRGNYCTRTSSDT